MKEYAIKRTDATGSVGYSPELESAKEMVSGWVDMLNGDASMRQTYSLVERTVGDMDWEEV